MFMPTNSGQTAASTEPIAKETTAAMLFKKKGKKKPGPVVEDAKTPMHANASALFQRKGK